LHPSLRAGYTIFWIRKMTEAIKYSYIELLTDKYQNDGVSKGSRGYIIEIYDPLEAYEVEFSRPNGETYATVVAHPSDFKVIDV